MPKKSEILLIGALVAVPAFALGWGFHHFYSHRQLGPPIPAESFAAKSSLLPPANATPHDRAPAEIAGNARPATSIIEADLQNGELPPDAMRRIMRQIALENDPIRRAALLSETLSYLTPDNALEAMKALAKAQGGRSKHESLQHEMGLLLNAWGRIDGANAIETLMQMEVTRLERGQDTKGRGLPDRIGNALQGWATTNPTAAAAFVDGLEDRPTQSRYRQDLVDALLTKSVGDAMRYLRDLPEGNRQGSRYMGSVAMEMLEQGVDAAVQWAEGLPDDLRGGAIGEIADAYAREDMEAAIAWANGHREDPTAAKALAKVASRWADDAPEAVIDWAGDLPQKTQTKLLEKTLDRWTTRDPLAASEYLAQMPQSPSKDAALEGFASQLAPEDPEAAAIWASTIEDDRLRTQTMSRITSQWARLDREAAEIWMQSNGFSEESLAAPARDRSQRKSKTKRPKR